jgi:hypothetical protein
MNMKKYMNEYTLGKIVKFSILIRNCHTLQI